MKTLTRPNVILDEMRRHREATKQPIHPGLTRSEAGLTRDQWELLSAGVCEDLTQMTERGDRWAHRALVILSMILIGLYFAGLLIGGPTHG